MKPRIHQTIKTVAFVLICLALLLAVAEYAATPLVYRQQQIPGRDLALLGFLALPNSKVDDTLINSQGFTGNVILDASRSTNSIRILTLGGSAFFNRRMTERLSAHLANATPRKVEVVGGALRTHTSRSSVIKYRYFRKFKFDYVVVYDGINDLWANNVQPPDYRSDYSHIVPWNRRNLLLDHSLLARYVYNNVIWKKPDFAPNGANFRADVDFENNLRTLVRMIKNDKATPLLMTIAWHIPPDYSMEKFWANTLTYHNPTDYDKTEVELWGHPSVVHEGLNRLNTIIRRVAAEETVPLLDQEGLLRGKARYFGDVCHMNEEGTTQFIENIRSFLVTNGMLS